MRRSFRFKPAVLVRVVVAVLTSAEAVEDFAEVAGPSVELRPSMVVEAQLSTAVVFAEARPFMVAALRSMAEAFAADPSFTAAASVMADITVTTPIGRTSTTGTGISTAPTTIPTTPDITTIRTGVAG